MDMVDRLIEKARKIKLTCGDSVFIISNETGQWTVDGQTFSDFEAAQEYVEGLLPDDEPESTVIINDLGPCDTDALEKLAVPDDWLDHLREENLERIRKEREKERLDRPPERDRRLI